MKLSEYVPSLITTLISIVVVLVIMGVTVLTGFQTENKTRLQAAKTGSILNNIRLLEASLLESETGQRGFILTQDEQYLAPYDTGKVEFERYLEKLASQMNESQTAFQKNILENLRKFGEEKFAELAETIALVKAGKRAEAMTIVNSDLGKNLMNKFRAEIARLEAEERSILQASLAEAKRIQDQTGKVLIGTFLMVLLLLAVVSYLFNRSEQLDRTEELLESVSLHKDRSDLLAQELSHRVKNLFGIIVSIVRMTGRGEGDATVVVRKISDRINALSRAHSLTTAENNINEVSLQGLIKTVLQPYDSKEHIYKLDGPNISLDSTVLTPLGLILHEMATNAIKYGAWSKENNGSVHVSWEKQDTQDQSSDHKRIKLIWSERLEPSSNAVSDMDKSEIIEKESSGFGTKMIQMSAQQMNGRIEKKWNNGLRMELEFEVINSA